MICNYLSDGSGKRERQIEERVNMQSMNNWKIEVKGTQCSMHYPCNFSSGFEISQNKRLMGEKVVSAPQDWR